MAVYHVLVFLVGIVGFVVVTHEIQKLGALFSTVLYSAFGFCIGHGAASLWMLLGQ